MRASTGKTFSLQEFGILNSTPRRYRSNGKIEDLLLDGTDLLKLTTPAKYVYTEDGTLVKSLDAVPSGSTLYLSVKRQSSQKKLSTPTKQEFSPSEAANFMEHSFNYEDDEAISLDLNSPRISPQSSTFSTPSKYSDTMSRTSSVSASPKSKSPSKFSPEKALIPEVKESPYVRYHQLLISLPGTTEDHLIFSMLSAYTSVPPEHRVNSTKYQSLEELLRTAQHRLFEKLLVSELIAPISADSIVNQPVYNKCYEILDEKKIDQIKLAILGPRRCGKTVVLHALAELFYRKVQICDSADTIFMFPFNVQKYVEMIKNGETEGFYKIVMRILFDSLLFARFQIWNLYQQIKEWFLCIPMVGSLLSIPKEIENSPFVDAQLMRKVGKQLHNVLHNNLVPPSEAFSVILTNIPEFAKIFHFDTTCFILDHVCETQNNFSVSLANAIGNSPYIVSGIEDSKFKSNFKKDFTPIIIEKFIEMEDNRRINFLNYSISIDDCNGLPGAIHLFDEAAKAAEQVIPQKKLGLSFQSKAASYSTTIACQKVLLLCDCIKESNPNKDYLSAMNELSEGNVKISLEC